MNTDTRALSLLSRRKLLLGLGASAALGSVLSKLEWVQAATVVAQQGGGELLGRCLRLR